MAVEIRELVLQARVLDGPREVSADPEASPQAADRQRQLILDECARMIRAEFDRRFGR